MICIVAGSRSITDYTTVKTAIEASGFDVTCLVSGGARGVDSLGERWAQENGVRIKRFPADWNKHGKAAGPIRNAEMADYIQQHASDWDGCGLIAVWDGISRGTDHMIDNAKSKNIPVFVYDVRPRGCVFKRKRTWR
jgi:hypothetical protein